MTQEFGQLSFARAHTKFCKLDASLKKGAADKRWATLVAAAKGFDHVIYTAITGPNRKKYNGSCGETGIEANADVARAICEAFVSAAAQMEDTELDEAIDGVITGSTECAPYGFDVYSAHLREGVNAAQAAFDLLPEDRQKKIEAVFC